MRWDRATRILEKSREKGAVGILLTRRENVFYLTGFNAGVLLVLPHEAWLLVPRLEEARARQQVEGVKLSVWRRREELWQQVGEKVQGRIGFDALDISLLEVVQRKGIEPVSVAKEVYEVRRRKDEEEIRIIEAAVRVTEEGLKAVEEGLRPGLRERELASLAERAMREAGAEWFSFECIVASGPNSAFPHHRTSDRELQRGDAVVVDIGARVNGYCADLTRTFVVGRAPESFEEVWSAVLEAQKLAIAGIRAGARCAEVDARARKFLEERKLGEAFIHSTGHGIGLEVHEPPRLSPYSNELLVAGDVVTVEPGVYLEGMFGVRIEDDVVVTEEGAKVLSRFPRSPV